MKITKRQLRRIIREAQWGRFTGGAAPLDEPPLDSGPMSPEDQQRVFDMLVDSGSDPKELKATGNYPDVESLDLKLEGRHRVLKEAVEDRNLAALLDFANGFTELDGDAQTDLNDLVNAHLEGTEDDFDDVVSNITPNSIEMMWDALNGVDSSIDDLLNRARDAVDVEEEL